MSDAKKKLEEAKRNRIGKKTIGKVYDKLEKFENDCTEALKMTRNLKRGILLGSMSREHQLKLCSDIIAVIEA